jgi:quercetin dioxygenase-like cupin family protein
MKPYLYLADLAKETPEVPGQSILSRTFFEDDQMKAILFAFAPGQELSEHTASHPAILHFLQGEADLTLDGDQHKAGPGTWVHLEPKLTHSIRARTPVQMLLLLFK